MATNQSVKAAELDYTWVENPDDIIVLVNNTSRNFILDLPAGRYRLDAGRRMRTLRSILKYSQILALVEDGSLTVQ